MPIPEDLTERGRRTIRKGLDVARSTAEKLSRGPGMFRDPDADVTAETQSPKYTIVQDLPDPLKETYLSLLVWLVHSDDRLIDERELCEIQILMTSFNAAPKSARPCDLTSRTPTPWT